MSYTLDEVLDFAKQTSNGTLLKFVMTRTQEDGNTSFILGEISDGGQGPNITPDRIRSERVWDVFSTRTRRTGEQDDTNVEVLQLFDALQADATKIEFQKMSDGTYSLNLNFLRWNSLKSVPMTLDPTMKIYRGYGPAIGSRETAHYTFSIVFLRSIF